MIVNLSLVCWTYHKSISNYLYSIQDFNFKPLKDGFYPPRPLSTRKLYINDESNKYSIYKYQNIKTIRLFHREYRFHEKDLSEMLNYLNTQLLCKLNNLSYIYIDIEHEPGTNSIHSISFVNELRLIEKLPIIIEIRKVSLIFLTVKLNPNVKFIKSLLIKQNHLQWDTNVNHLIGSVINIKCLKMHSSEKNTPFFKKLILEIPRNPSIIKLFSSIPELRIECIPISYLSEILSLFNHIREFHFSSCFKGIKDLKGSLSNCNEHNDAFDYNDRSNLVSLIGRVIQDLPNLETLSITNDSCKNNGECRFNTIFYQILCNSRIKKLFIKGCTDLTLLTDLINSNKIITDYHIIVEKVKHPIEVLIDQIEKIKSLILQNLHINLLVIQFSTQSKRKVLWKNKDLEYTFDCNSERNSYLVNYQKGILYKSI